MGDLQLHLHVYMKTYERNSMQSEIKMNFNDLSMIFVNHLKNLKINRFFESWKFLKGFKFQLRKMILAKYYFSLQTVSRGNFL